MSFPPPPGLNNSSSSLPPRPPPSASAAPPSYASPGTTTGGGYGGGKAPGAGYSASTAFQPRAVAAASQPYRTSSPVVSAPPTNASGYPTPATSSAGGAGYGNYYSQQPQTYQNGPSYYGQAQYNDAAYGSSMPYGGSAGMDQSNAYVMRGRNYGRNDSGLDPETEAQIAQWQSAYVNREEMPAATGPAKGPGRLDTAVPGAGATTNTATPSTDTPVGTATTATTPNPVSGREDPAPKTVVRAGGGQKWTDSTLLEWDPAHFRLFVGNLAGEVTDDSLFKAFSQFPSVQKARVIRDKRTQKSKGYGFVSFSDGDDYFKAAREMQGKYIGSHPILLRRAQTEIRPTSTNALKSGKKHGGGKAGGGSGGNQSLSKVKQDGVKKPGKTKGGLKILG